MKNSNKILCYYHSKDMDGWFSGAIIKYKYPNSTLIGYDYYDELPDVIKTFKEGNYDEVIFIDVTLPIHILNNIGKEVKLTVIDHHIQFKKSYDDFYKEHKEIFNYIYNEVLSACEIASIYYLGYISKIVEYVGKYDTWRKDDFWEDTSIIKEALYSIINCPESVPEFYIENNSFTKEIRYLKNIGEILLNSQKIKNKNLVEKFSFETIAFNNLRALVINTNNFSSEIFEGYFDSNKHDIMIGFSHTGKVWWISLRSVGDLDVSEIAKQRGGGGHKNAAGFSIDGNIKFKEIFK